MRESVFQPSDIIIADDSLDNLRVLTEILTAQGYLVRPAISGHVALKAIQNCSPDLVLLDIVMPDLDGYEVCRQIKAQHRTRDIPIIFMSALGEIVDKVKAFEAGAVDYITKPFYAEEILARVKIHLSLRTLQRELQAQNGQLQQEIAERAQVEDALKASEQQLRELNASKDKLLSIIGHDLKSPLASLHTLLQFAEDYFETYTPEKLKELVVMQRTSIENLLKLLDNLLAWSRLQRGLFEYFPQRFPIEQAIRRNVDLFGQMAAQKQIRVHASVDPQVFVYADYNMLDTVIRNLMSNALKFTPVGGSVEISVRPCENGVEVAVTDTGLGIAADVLPFLFQIDRIPKRLGTAHETGTGLGLFVCQELLAKNRGRLDVESAVGKGTTFRLTLPTKD
jgi:two-component system, sensor histidine kinase and response regulator